VDVIFCPHCGAPLSGSIAIDPYKRIAAEGWMYGQVTHAPMGPIVVAGMWLMFCLTLLLAVGALAEAFRDTDSGPGERVLFAILGAASIMLATVFGHRVYQNFRRHTKRGKR
jgi:hypothetical protein